MLEVGWAAALALVFVELLHRLGVVTHSREVIGLSRASLSVIGNAGLDDEAKEVALQANTRRLFGLFVALTLRGATALAVPFALLWGADALGWVSIDGVLAASLSVPFLIVVGLLATIALVRRRS